MGDYMNDLADRLRGMGLEVNGPDEDGDIQLVSDIYPDEWQYAMFLSAEDGELNLVGFGWDGHHNQSISDSVPMSGDPTEDAKNAAESFNECLEMFREYSDQADQYLDERSTNWDDDWDEWEDD